MLTSADTRGDLVEVLDVALIHVYEVVATDKEVALRVGPIRLGYAAALAGLRGATWIGLHHLQRARKSQISFGVARSATCFLSFLIVKITFHFAHTISASDN